jgi:hypothetical protein
MKSSPHICGAAFLSLLLVATSLSLSAAEKEKDKPLVALARTATPAPSATPATVEPPTPPLSTFVVPRKPIDGRDPFFPNSTRVFDTDSAPTNRTPTVVADLVLKGISGTAEQPLAIINSTTFTAGEINEVLLKTGRMRIQCVEINMAAGSVLIQIGGERRELRLAQK